MHTKKIERTKEAIRVPLGSKWDSVLRYSVVLFGEKHVVAQVFPDGYSRAAFREHIVRLYNATII